MDIKGYSTETARIDREEIAEIRQKGFRKASDILDVLRVNRSGEFLLKTKSAKQVNASNHYAFTYFIDYTKNYVEFNFSIPKYIFGSNILMFVDHYGDKQYAYHTCSELDHNINRAFERLHQFLKVFFKMEFLGCPVEYEDVEVNRIDVCFNQVFPNRDEALRYLEYQKRLKKSMQETKKEFFESIPHHLCMSPKGIQPKYIIKVLST